MCFRDVLTFLKLWLCCLFYDCNL